MSQSKETPLHEEHSGDNPLDLIVGTSPAMCEVKALVTQVSERNTTVLIQGESGTGKELVAWALHRLSPRGSGPFLTLNCAAVPADLIESELFGHKRGAFTGAVSDHKGLFRAADTGTLFLDEIEATQPAMQVKLLRSLQTGEVRPVGEILTQQVDVRLVAASNRDLYQYVNQGLFREDLFYRINVFPIHLAPLRERKEDIPVLTAHILGKLFQQTGKSLKGLDAAAMELLQRYSWPGNVRELENELERAHVLVEEGGTVSVRCLSPRLTDSVEQLLKESATPEPQTLKEAVEELERRMVIDALTKSDGNRSKAAEYLGLSRQGLLNKIHKYGLDTT
ncbi:MAG: sigma-54 dependent transcriptional regulator [Thermodesulfobacteriota bacterium]